jgi:hypothetical protein
MVRPHVVREHPRRIAEPDASEATVEIMLEDELFDFADNPAMRSRIYQELAANATDPNRVKRFQEAAEYNARRALNREM